MRRMSILVVLCFLIACSPKQERRNVESPVSPAFEKHRPKVHFTPAEGWMNDPNGMFYLDGEYHLFYQHYPDSTVWGPMHWGHAVSRDLVHWERLPIALYPDSLGYIFSGSAVVDLNNTSGFGAADNPAVVAIYTYHDATAERAGTTNVESQGIAYSTDKGRTWTKYHKNPVLRNPNIRDFRDPKVSWNDDAKHWVMTLAVKDHVEFYGSSNLKEWTKLSEFGRSDGDHSGVWECPDLFKLQDDAGNSKYVLLVSINPGAPNGGSGTQYFIGNFDGRRFISDLPGKNAGWIDYGPDDYAGVTFANVPPTDGRRIFVGWMSNWLYADRVPTRSWRGAMTVPRTLSLLKTHEGYTLNSLPVKELDNLIAGSRNVHATVTDTLNLVAKEDSLSVPILVRGSVSKSGFIIELRNNMGQRVLFGFDESANEYYIDRGTNIPASFHQDFRNKIRAPRKVIGDTITFTAIVDVASVELFFDEGSTTLTAITFPDEVFDEISMYGRTSNLHTGPIQIHSLRPIW